MTSCTNLQEKTKINELISKVETHLTPSVVIEGKQDTLFTIDERMEYYKVPGLSIAIIFNGKIQWAKGYGYTSYDSTKMIDENTLFQAASISKPVAAMAALYLVQEGRISLDMDVNKYLRDWKIVENRFTEKEKVTLRRLLSHSAGLTVSGFKGYAEGEDVPDITRILNGEPPANNNSIRPDTVPGQLYRYSGGGYTVAQKMLTDITGIPFQAFMQQTVLSRIGMSNSYFYQPLPGQFHNNASIGHNSKGDPVEGKWHTYPELAAAGLWTTPTDLAKFAIEVQQSLKGLSNKVLSKELTEQMVTRYFKHKGLGFDVIGDGDSIRFGHGGGNKGYRCQSVAFKNFGQGAVIMTNSDNGSDLMSEVLRSISWTYNWNIFPPAVRKIGQ